MSESARRSFDAAVSGNSSQSPAMKRLQFRTHFQPIYPISTQLVHISAHQVPLPAGFEALTRARLSDPSLVDMTSLRDALRFYKMMKTYIGMNKLDIDTTTLFVSVNFSPETLANENLMFDVRDNLKKYGVRPRNLKIEILETPFPEGDFNTIKENIYALRSAGHKVVLDDFLKDDSNEERLELLGDGISGIKLDISFLSLPPEEQKRLIENLASYEITLEGLETREHIETALNTQATLGQGFLFNNPMRARLALLTLGNRQGVPARPEIQTPLERNHPPSEPTPPMVA